MSHTRSRCSTLIAFGLAAGLLGARLWELAQTDLGFRSEQVLTARVSLPPITEPAVLEARLTKPAGLGALLPGGRQAQYWALFTQLYASISREAEDDFEELFGREFGRAYEEQSAKLHKG